MGQTSIPVDGAVRDELIEGKPEGVSWSEYLSGLASGDDVASGASDGELAAEVRRLREEIEALPMDISDELERRFS